MGRVFRVVANGLFGLIVALIAFIILALTVLPPVLRYQTYVVLSGSMEPTIHIGSVIVATAVDPNELRVGDIITYQRPTDKESVTHRIVQIKGSADGRAFVTQGDANGTPDLGDIRFDRLAGKVQMSVPYLGYIFNFIGSPTMRFLFIVVPGILLLGSWLWEIWRPDPHGKGADRELAGSMAPAPSEPAQMRTSKARKSLGMAADAAAVPLRQ